MSEPTIYDWRKRLRGLELSELRKLRALWEENCRPKRIVANRKLVAQKVG